jgi:hypothetical protein
MVSSSAILGSWAESMLEGSRHAYASPAAIDADPVCNTPVAIVNIATATHQRSSAHATFDRWSAVSDSRHNGQRAADGQCYNVHCAGVPLREGLLLLGVVFIHTPVLQLMSPLFP